MVDPIAGGLTSSKTATDVLRLAWEVISYIRAVKGAKTDKQKFIVELTRVTSLLTAVRDIADDVMNEDWAEAISSLEGPTGPLRAFFVLVIRIKGELGVKLEPEEEAELKQTSSISVLGSSRLAGWLQNPAAPNTPTDEPLTQSQNTSQPSTGRPVSSNRRKDFVLERLKWPFLHKRLDELLKQLEPIKLHFMLALSGDNIRLCKTMRAELQSVHSNVVAVKEDTLAIRQHQEGSKAWTSEQDLIFQSFSAMELSSEMAPEELARLKKYASWVLQHDEFGKWREDRSTFLLTGRAGEGKTCICRTVEDFLRAFDASEVFVVAIYFSTQNKPENQSLQAVLAFIVRRMLAIHPRFQRYYNKLMLTGEGPLEVSDSLRIIHRARQDFQRFYVLLDGLDECAPEQAQELVERLTSLHPPLQTFATTRPSSLASSFAHNLTITPELISDSIIAYARDVVARKLAGSMA